MDDYSREEVCDAFNDTIDLFLDIKNKISKADEDIITGYFFLRLDIIREERKRRNIIERHNAEILLLQEEINKLNTQLSKK